MQLGYTILYVKDVPASVEFYEKALGLTRRLIHESGFYAEMETGATTLAFISTNLADANLPCGFRENSLADPPPGISITLVADDAIAAYNHAVASGATSVKEPTDKPWGQWVAYVRDPDGILVEITAKLAS